MQKLTSNLEPLTLWPSNKTSALLTMHYMNTTYIDIIMKITLNLFPEVISL